MKKRTRLALALAIGLIAGPYVIEGLGITDVIGMARTSIPAENQALPFATADQTSASTQVLMSAWWAVGLFGRYQGRLFVMAAPKAELPAKDQSLSCVKIKARLADEPEGFFPHIALRLPVWLKRDDLANTSYWCKSGSEPYKLARLKIGKKTHDL